MVFRHARLIDTDLLGVIKVLAIKSFLTGVRLQPGSDNDEAP
jgi:hypothetical protein